MTLHVGDCEHGRKLTEDAKRLGLDVEVGKGDPYWHCAACAYERNLAEAIKWREAKDKEAQGDA